MNIKHVFSRALLIIALFLSNIAFAEESLVGYWLSTSKSSGDMVSILEFRNDGTVAHTMSIMRDYHYSIEGDNLTLKPIDKPDAGEKIFFANFNKNELTLKQSEKDDGLILKRINESDDKNNKEIIGQWYQEAPDTKGIVEYYIFTKEGIVRYRLPMPGSTVTNYIIKGDTLKMSRKDMEPTNSRWHIKNDYLTLSSEEGKEWTYKRGHDTIAQQSAELDGKK